MGRFEFMDVGLNSPGKSWHIARHRHDFNEIIVVMWSKERISMDAGGFEASEGEVLVFRPRTWHEEWSGESPPLETIFFTFNGTLPAQIPVKFSDSKGRLRLIAGWMLSEARTLEPSELRELMQGYLDAFIAESMRLIRHRESPLVESIRSIIVRSPEKNHSLDSLAKASGLSKYHFLRKYTRLAGRSPADDVRKIRLSIAKDLLISTDEPLKNIAGRTGLGDEATLCRLFRKYYGRSPGRFRN